ncbi:MAG: formamidopyrimidine-DNA, partial [Planctomycetota bacterium]
MSLGRRQGPGVPLPNPLAFFPHSPRMPELPDLSVYLEHLDRRCTGRSLVGVRLASMFLLRSVDPPLDAFRGKTVRGFRRIGKRIVFCFDEGLFLV